MNQEKLFYQLKNSIDPFLIAFSEKKKEGGKKGDEDIDE